MKRNRKRRDPGTAVLRFFIWLLIVLMLCGLGVFMLGTGKNSGPRPYIATGTGEPVTKAPVIITPEPTSQPTPEPTEAAPVATATPVAAPTATPLPTAVPTPIPESALPTELKKFTLPAETNDGQVGISNCYVSAVDSFSIMELTGWGYADLDYFDGEECGTYIIVLQGTKPIHAYLATSMPGISGRSHTGAMAKNPSECDWRVYIDVSDYDPGLYSLGAALCYKNGSNDEYRYYRFGDLQSFTVNDGEIIIPVTVTGAY
ncbi:MAG: hypothetical protein IJC56_08680 [Clostridia bacterium]|nr:hypothetical protein [Clostridia bacterium]